MYYTFLVTEGGELFSVKTPLGVMIRTTGEYWNIIVTIKHPSISKYKHKVQETLKEPDQIRISKKDPRVHLYYKNIGTVYVCVVADHTDKVSGYIITAYLTDRIKEGKKIYGKN